MGLPVRALTLDLDDTLWDVRIVIGRAERELMAWTVAEYPRIAESFDSKAALSLRDEVMRDHPEKRHDFRFLRSRVFARMAAHCGYPEDFVRQAFEVFDHWRNTVELYEDAAPALDALASRFPLIAVTNGNADLARIGIGHWFTAHVSAADAGVAKPHRAIFDRAQRRALVPHGAMLHVGDDPEADVRGAREAGLQSVWINRRNVDWPDELDRADVEVSNLRELLDALG